MDASLRNYGKRIELFDDTQSDMYLFIEKAIRGGISFISHRHSKANNKYMPNYDKTRPSIFILYLDANNLYGGSMSEPLAIGNYRWDDATNWNTERILNINDNDTISYIFIVDLEYPEEIHDYHNSYPLAPEKKLVKSEWLSDYQNELKTKLKIHNNTVEKLVTDLNDKYNYTIYYKNLQLYLQLGMKLKKVHKVMSFMKAPWLKNYITTNSALRQKAKAKKDAFGDKIYKIKNNSVFGKQMENVRNRCNVELVKANNKKYLKLLSHPTFKKRTIFSENLVAVHRHKKQILLNKPIINGFLILEISKYKMYNFYYNVLKKRYGDKIKLLFTDTDSLCVEIETDDVYVDMSEMKEHFDFSEYPKNHFLYSTENQAVVAKFKDEVAGKIITEFIGLRSKLYSLTVQNDKVKKTAKGVKKCIINNKLSFDDYKNTLNEKTQLCKDMLFFKSNKHSVNTISVNKICFSAYHNKRYILDDGVTSYAYGQYKIKK